MPVVAGLARLGRPEGRVVLLGPTFAEGQDGRLPDMAAKPVALEPVVTVAGGAPATRAPANAPPPNPIAMAPVRDPVARGILRSLAEAAIGAASRSGECTREAVALPGEIRPIARPAAQPVGTMREDRPGSDRAERPRADEAIE